jgi:hypothetical protein
MFIASAYNMCIILSSIPGLQALGQGSYFYGFQFLRFVGFYKVLVIVSHTGYISFAGLVIPTLLTNIGIVPQLGLLVLTIVSVIFSAAGFMFVTENAATLPDAGIHNFVDALYYIAVTLSTVGYGDITPK